MTNILRLLGSVLLAFLMAACGGGGGSAGTTSGDSGAGGGGSTPGTGTATATITSEDVCTWSLSSASQNFAIAGGLGSFNVTVNPGCSWTAVSNAPWITTASTGVGTAPAGEPVGAGVE